MAWVLIQADWHNAHRWIIRHPNFGIPQTLWQSLFQIERYIVHNCQWQYRLVYRRMVIIGENKQLCEPFRKANNCSTRDAHSIDVNVTHHVHTWSHRERDREREFSLRRERAPSITSQHVGALLKSSNSSWVTQLPHQQTILKQCLKKIEDCQMSNPFESCPHRFESENFEFKNF